MRINVYFKIRNITYFKIRNNFNTFSCKPNFIVLKGVANMKLPKNNQSVRLLNADL